MVLAAGQIEKDIERVRSLIGHEMRVNYRFNLEVTRDGVRHLAWGVGDDNPLWLDPEYAAGTDYGQLVAPPSYLYTIHPTFVQIGFSGVHGFHANTHWKLFKPVLVGQKPSSITWLHDVVEKEGRMGGHQILVYFRTVYFDENRQLLAECTTSSMRIQRDKARSKNKHSGWEQKRWSVEELEPIEEAQFQEKPRGADPRYFEDVQVGDLMDEVSKGPLNLSDMIAWYVGSVPVYSPAHELAIKQYRHKPKFYYRNTTSGALESGIRVHEDVAAAKAAGVPAPYDLGVQRNQWQFHLLTNWVGDNGWIVDATAEYRAFNFFGDIQTLGGEVVRKEVTEDGENLVHLRLWCKNQRGEDIMPGTAIVSLPSKDSTESPVAKRIRTEGVNVDDYLAQVVPDLVRL